MFLNAKNGDKELGFIWCIQVYTRRNIPLSKWLKIGTIDGVYLEDHPTSSLVSNHIV